MKKPGEEGTPENLVSHTGAEGARQENLLNLSGKKTEKTNFNLVFFVCFFGVIEFFSITFFKFYKTKENFFYGRKVIITCGTD